MGANENIFVSVILIRGECMNVLKRYQLIEQPWINFIPGKGRHSCRELSDQKNKIKVLFRNHIVYWRMSFKHNTPSHYLQQTVVCCCT